MRVAIALFAGLALIAAAIYYRPAPRCHRLDADATKRVLRADAHTSSRTRLEEGHQEPGAERHDEMPFASLREERASKQMVNLGNAVNAYFREHVELPDALATIARPDPRTGATYMASIPVDPWGNAYRYRQLGRVAYVILSVGEDGMQGTSDDLRYDAEAPEAMRRARTHHGGDRGPLPQVQPLPVGHGLSPLLFPARARRDPRVHAERARLNRPAVSPG